MLTDEFKNFRIERIKIERKKNSGVLRLSPSYLGLNSYILDTCSVE